MKTEYTFTEGKVKGIWAVSECIVDEKNPDEWQPPKVSFGGGPKFTFDKEKIYSYWPDYPDNLTEEQIKLFNKAFPYWGEFKDWGGYPPDDEKAPDVTKDSAIKSPWDTRF